MLSLLKRIEALEEYLGSEQDEFSCYKGNGAKCENSYIWESHQCFGNRTK